MRFTKMQGAGNDYVYVNCFAEPLPADPAALARKITDRHFGVGGDGLILICPSQQADARMRMFNVDGSEAEMCGNGVRCVAKYVYDHGICRKDSLKIETGRGVLALDLETAGGLVERVRVNMGQPILEAEKIPTRLPGDPVVNRELAGGGTHVQGHLRFDGQPALRGVRARGDRRAGAGGRPEDRGRSALSGAGERRVRRGPLAREVRQRTWERGSGETLACGTGASAVCVAGVLTGRTNRKMLVHLSGGDLQLEWNEADNHVYMTGPAVEVFSGEWIA